MKTNMRNCGVTGSAQTAVPKGEATVQAPIQKPAASMQQVAAAEGSGKFSEFCEFQDLFRTRLDAPLLKLIGKLTGVRLHVLWHHPLDFQGPGEVPALCPKARQRTSANRRQPQRCESCWQRCWQPALFSASQAQPFSGLCGSTNYCACLQVDDDRPLTLVLQTRIAARALATPQRSTGRSRIPHHTTSPAAFQHAVALVRLILHDLEATAQARLARNAAETPLPTLNHPQGKATRLDGEFPHPLVDLPSPAAHSHSGNHARKLVDVMRDYVRQHYHRPFGLDDLASAMNMNASYLSALFSQTTGVTFHHFLEEVRLSRAKELLRDPRHRIGEVANATGYASPDAFRHAFKSHENLSPDAWRARL